ncbi:Hypothetical protein FKW44_023022 [Caligus rogercresseyi]|uniref:Uncharacterized protein n=1 Tax=Caligus rogercresseyi TaxID=217165 RepID=A0A7T8GNR3_CALRO|nr:Hypothetical protein FKW44_023022 [Caligus rogercresseyi]
MSDFFDGGTNKKIVLVVLSLGLSQCHQRIQSMKKRKYWWSCQRILGEMRSQ